MTGLLERSDELTAIDAALRRVLRGSGTFVLVDGPAGIGKTALLAEAMRRADTAGIRVLHAAGGELERDFPFGVVRALLGPATDGEAPVALRAEAGPSGPAEGDQAGAIADVHRFVARRAAAAPLVLVVDDVHWADGASIHCLAYLARRLDGLPLALLAAGRESDHVRALRRGDGTVQLRPRPLSAEATSRLVLAAAPAADAAVCDACHVATGGTPLYVREVARGLEAHGLDAGADAARRVLTWSPEDLTRMVGDRLAALPAEARALAQALAILDAGASAHEAGALAGVDAEGRARAGDALRAIGVLAAGRPLAFAHPVLRAAVAETLLPGAADRLHRRAADLLAEQGATAQRIAAQVMVCEPAADPQACDRLLAAADDALARRAPETAMRHLRRALAEPQAGDAARGRVLAALGSAEALSFEQDAAVAHLEEAVDLAPDPLQRLDAALNLVSAIGMGSGNAAPTIRTLLAKLADLDDPALVAQVEAQLVLQGLLSADGRRATAELGARILERVGEAGGSWAELAVAAIELTIAGTERERVVALARASLETDEGHPAVRATALVTTVRCLGAADALDLAEELIGPEPGAGDPGAAGYVHHYLGYFRADLRLRRGDFHTADRIATATWTAAVEHGWPMMRQAATGLLAELCVVSGDLARGERLVVEAGCDEPAAALPDHYTTLMLLGGRGRLRLAAGRVDEGIADLRACGLALEARGEPNPALIGWRAPLAIALGGEEGHALAAENLRLARRFGAPRAVAIALRAAAALATARDGRAAAPLGEAASDGRAAAPLGESAADPAAALLHEAAALLATAQAGRYEHARILADLAAIDHTAGRTTAARDRLLEAYELAHRCGAGALEREVADGLRALGARPRRPFVRGPEALTVRERSVTALAAGGASNREIADELVVTVRTVEFHLSRAFRKLGVASRTELDGALAAAPHPPFA